MGSNLSQSHGTPTISPMVITTTASAVARAAYNALLYSSKAPPWDAAMFDVHPDHGVSFLTSDGYALCSSPVEDAKASPFGGYRCVKITRVDLVAMEARARADKKEGIQLEIEQGKGITYLGPVKEEDILFEDIYVEGEEGDSWDDVTHRIFIDLIEQRSSDPDARAVMLGREYLRKLGQIKADKNVAADIWFGPSNEPALIRVGRTQLVIQTIDRQEHADYFEGQEVKW